MKAFSSTAISCLAATNSLLTAQAATDTSRSPFSQSEFRPFNLGSAEAVSHDTKLFTFLLPQKDMPLALEIPSCITFRFVDEAGEEVIRPYTPLNLSCDKGAFTTLVKCYPGSKMGTHLHNMKIGATIGVQGPWRSMEIPPRKYTNVGLVIGGTGITPAFQIVRNFLADPSNLTKFFLLYCNKSEKDVLLKDSLDQLMRDNPTRFSVSYLMADAPASWPGYKGMISKEILKETMPSPDKNGKHMVIVSGPPGFMKAVCGMKDGRDQGPLGGLLKEMGYTEDMVHKF